MITFLWVLFWVLGYTACGFLTLYEAFRVYGPLPEPDRWHSYREDAILGYVLMTLFWPIGMWAPITTAVYRRATAPKKQAMVYDPEYTAKLERDLAEMKRITDQHRSEK